MNSYVVTTRVGCDVLSQVVNADNRSDAIQSALFRFSVALGMSPLLIPFRIVKYASTQESLPLLDLMG